MARARLLQALAVGAAAALLMLLLRQLGWLDLWEFRSRDLRTRWTVGPERVVRDDVRLVMVTDESIKLLHDNNDMNWPWDWDFHGLMLQKFGEGKAESVLFDFQLLERRDGHERLLDALKKAPPSWFAASFRDRGVVADPELDERLVRFAIPVESDGSVEIPEPYQKAIPPAAEIADGLAGIADISTPRDDDGMMRRYRILSKYRGRYYPTFALAGLMAREKARGVSLKDGALRVGTRSIPVEKDGTFLLRYYPAGTSFPWKPAWPVLGLGADRVDPAFYRGAAIVVGTSASGLTDLRMTPVSEVMPGPEVHATALANLLNGDFLREARSLSVAVLLLLAFGTALLTRHASAAAGGAAALGLLAATALGSVLLFRARWVVELVAPMGAVVLSFASATAVNFLTEGRQRLRTKREFQRYMSPKVVEKVLKNPDAMSMAGERKVISIFFMDFAGFTSMSEKLDAVEVVKLMNDYHNEAAEEIFRTEGTLDKFIGDAIMAFWNDPIEQPDHALRACTTAIEAQKRLVVMARRMRERGLPEMTARIGINTGIATMGNMGAKVQFQYTAIGDEVNLASRLEGVNKEFGSKIIVAEPTWQAAKDRVEARVLALIKVKGKKLPVRIHELLGLKGEVPADELAGARAFEAALEEMQNRRFAEAREAFRALAGKGDRAAALYVDVCSRYLEEAPPPDWDGSYQMDHK